MKPTYDITTTLRRQRLLAGDLTQQELADRAGVSRQTIVSIEKGRYNPTVGLALTLARILDTTVEALFHLAPEDSP